MGGGWEEGRVRGLGVAKVVGGKQRRKARRGGELLTCMLFSPPGQEKGHR